MTSISRFSVVFCIIFGTLSLIQGFVLEEFLLFRVKAKNLSGNFPKPPNDGAVCKWYEQGSGTKTETRGFQIKCKVGNKSSYECTYKGNPHKCNWYNKGNQGKFYMGLAEDAATNHETACSKQELEYEKKCSGIIFKKE